jgi:hypothetical protein
MVKSSGITLTKQNHKNTRGTKDKYNTQGRDSVKVVLDSYNNNSNTLFTADSGWLSATRRKAREFSFAFRKHSPGD